MKTSKKQVRINPFATLLLATLMALGTFVGCETEREAPPAERVEERPAPTAAPAEGEPETGEQMLPGQQPTADVPLLGEDAEQQPPGETAQLGPVIDELANKLPQSVVSLVVVDTNGFIQTLTPGGDEKTRQQLRQDLGQLFTTRFGIDPTGAEWMTVIGGEDQWMALIINGDVQTAQGLETIDIAGTQAQQLKGGDVVLFDYEGYKVLTTRDWAPKLLQAEGNKLAQAAHFNKMKQVVQEAEAGSILAVTTLDNPMMGGFTANLPQSVQNLDAIALTSGNQIALLATGTSEEIQALQTEWQQMRQNFVGTLDAQYQQRQQLDFQQALGTIVTRAFANSLLTAWEPQFEGEVAQVRIDPTVMQEGMTLVLLGGAASWMQMARGQTVDVTVEAPEPAGEAVDELPTAPEPVEPLQEEPVTP